MEGKKTIFGLAVSALGFIFMTFDIEFTVEETQNLVNQVMMAYGLLQALYGRIVARGPLVDRPRVVKFKDYTNDEMMSILTYAKNLRGSRQK